MIHFNKVIFRINCSNILTFRSLDLRSVLTPSLFLASPCDWYSTNRNLRFFVEQYIFVCMFNTGLYVATYTILIQKLCRLTSKGKKWEKLRGPKWLRFCRFRFTISFCWWFCVKILKPISSSHWNHGFSVYFSKHR